MNDMDNTELLLLILGRKGGKTSTEIIDELLKRPYNINQLSKNLNRHYNTIHYHIRLLQSSKIIRKMNKRYGALYCPTKKLKDNIDEYKLLKSYLELEE